MLTSVSVFLLSALVITSSAQERTVGVNVGEWFEYDHIFDWSSSDPNATIPPYFELVSEIEWTNITILDVSGTNVTFQSVMHLKNGTDLTNLGLTDVDTGEGNATNWVVSANLDPNDSIYTTGDYSSWKINETIVKTYPDGVRDTNHVNITKEMNMTGVYMYASNNFYWDRSSGIVVEMTIIQISQMEAIETNMTSIIKITESDVWVIPEFSTYTSLLLTLVLLTVPIVTIKRRLLKTSIQ
ncbi:MAG: hypothetical protein JSV51_03700 [Candidatus Bathyarchaeota archaeon]|nr:MAG: hypothetical protein JSV51_03700 [Candidatus Bathyarchaeota archaeon]